MDNERISLEYKLVQTLSGHSSSVKAVAVFENEDDTKIVSGSGGSWADGTDKIWKEKIMQLTNYTKRVLSGRWEIPGLNPANQNRLGRIMGTNLMGRNGSLGSKLHPSKRELRQLPQEQGRAAYT